MITRRRIIVWVVLTVLIAAIVWKLASNKQQLETNKQAAAVSRSFVPVEVTQLRRDTLSRPLEADGIFLPIKEMFVFSETQGRVVEVFKEKGEWVNEGEVIARVDDELLRTELEATRANLAKLRTDRERLERLISGEAVPKAKIEDVRLAIVAAEAKEKALLKQISNTRIKAPMTGTLGLRFIERGSVIGPGIQVGQMTDLRRLSLMVKAPESDVLRIKKGQSVQVLADVMPDKPLNGQVNNIGLRADNTFNYDVEIQVPNLEGQPLRGGMHARAIFNITSGRQGLTLPRKALVGSVQDPKVYVVAGDSLGLLRSITIGEVYADRVEVRSGLSETDKVVVSGQLNLSDSSRVSIVRGNE